MTIDINERGLDAAVAYEDVIREAVLATMRAPELVASRQPLTSVEHADLVEHLHEVRALLYRLLEMITQP